MAIAGVPLTRRVTGKRALMTSLIVLAGIAAPMGAWSAHNYLAYDRVILVNSAGPENFWKGNNPFIAKYGDADLIHRQEDGHDQMLADWSAMPVVEKTKGLPLDEAGPLYLDAAFDFIRENPGAFLELTASKFINLWRLYPKTVHKNVHTNRLTSIVGALSYGPMLLLGLWGAVLAAKRWRECALVYGYVLSLTAVYSVIHSSVRYRLPLDFFVAAFAGLAVSTLVHGLTRRTSRGQPTR